MKKWLTGGTIVIVFLAALTSAAFARVDGITPLKENIKLIVNGNIIETDVAPQLINGRVLAPVRSVAETLGANVQWDDHNRIVTINKKELFKAPGMLYMQPDYKKRFIQKESRILLLPVDGSPEVQNIIRPNTVVDVNDKVQVDSGGVWLYVTIPVYDSPMNMKGWIKETDTTPYNKENQKLVQSDVNIKAGTPVYETYDFNKISSIETVKLIYDKRGRLVERENGYVLLSCPGGEVIIVKEQYIVYPEIQ